MTRTVGATLLVAAGYAVTGKLSMLLSIPPEYVSIIWPPAGVALAAILLLGYRGWVGVFLGAMLANVWRRLDEAGPAAITQAADLIVPACLGLGAAAQACAGAWLVRRWVGSPGPLDTVRDIALFSLLGGAVACLILPTWGLLVLVTLGNIPASAFLSNLWMWWIGDVLGVLLVTPLLLTLGAAPREVWRARRMSLGLPFLGVLALAIALFILANAREQDHITNEFQQDARDIANNLSMSLRSNLDSVHLVGDLLRGHDEQGDQSALDHLDELLASASGGRALQWVPAIPRGALGSGRAAQPDGFSYPMRLVISRGQTTTTVNMDLGTMPAALRVIQAARETGQPTLSAPMDLPLPHGEEPAFLTLLPVYERQQDEAPARRLRGLVAGVLFMDERIAFALSHLDLAGLAVHVHDITDPGQAQLLYVRTPAEATQDSFQVTAHQEMSGRLLRVTLTPTLTALRQQRSWEMPIIWVGGLLVVGLMGTLLLLVTGHTARIEAQVAAQAGALTEARVALRQAEFLRRLAGSNVIGIFIGDTAGTVIEANDAFLSMLGYGREALAQGQVRWDEVTPPEWQAGDRAALARIDEAGAAPAWEKEYLRPDGTRVPVMLGATRLEAEEQYVAFVVDLTQVKQTKAELERRTAELEQYKTIVNSTPTPIFAKQYSGERQGVYILANPRSNELLGKETIVGLTDEDLLPAEVATILQMHDRQVLARGTPEVLDESLLDARTGERIHTIVTKVPLSDAGGEPYGVAGISLDITEQKLLTERLAALVDAIPDVLFRMRADGTYLDVKNNRDLGLAMAPETIVGSNLRDAPLPEEIRRLSLDAIARAVETGEIQEIEYSLDESQGLRHYEIRIVKSGHDEVVVLVRDITETRRARAALEQTNAKLRAANEELKEFAYVASHDLQEPLRTVRSFVELLERRYGDAFDERGRKWMGFIVNGTQRMRALIDDLLAYSRVGRMGEVGQVDTARLVREVLDDARASIDAAGAVVRVGDLPAITAVASEMRQVFQNLISNALKFRRPDAPPQVTIEVEQTPAGWAFVVADNGIGIDAAYHERIFLVFQRLHARDEYPGTGIGLALVKKIIERQGGEISVRSTPGEGTTFRFTVPAVAWVTAGDASPDRAGM